MFSEAQAVVISVGEMRPSAMVKCMCQIDWVMGYPDCCSNIILDVSVKVVWAEIKI